MQADSVFKDVGVNVSVFLKVILLLSLVLNQGLSVFASSSAMAKMQSYADENTLAICTGQSVKWISADIFYQSGELVEVDVQADIPDTLHEVSCVLAQLADLPKTLAEHNNLQFTTNVFSVLPFTESIRHKKSLFSAFFSSRAPPIFSL
jgi:hypothetical protein